MRRQSELRRDVEAMAMLNNTSVTDTGAGGNAGETAGLEAWVSDKNVLDATVYKRHGRPTRASIATCLPAVSPLVAGLLSRHRAGSATWQRWTTPVSRQVNAITEVAMLDVVQQLYENGYGEDRNYVAMCRPALKRRVSKLLLQLIGAYRYAGQPGR